MFYLARSCNRQKLAEGQLKKNQETLFSAVPRGRISCVPKRFLMFTAISR